MFIDTHTHLFLEQFDIDRQQTIQRALDAGVSKLFLPNIDRHTIAPMMLMVEQYPQHCFPMIGLHPTHVKETYLDELQIVEQWLKKTNFYAIGEIGIDLYWDKTYLSQQIEAFRYQIQLAKTHKLPIVIHARDSFDEIFAVIEQLHDNNLRGIFHSFTGTMEQAERIISWGFKLGINGIVTFAKSGLDNIVAKIDLKHIVLETDSPYLAPVPYRGKRNQSSYISYIAHKIAKIHNKSITEIAQITSLNAEAVFNKI